MDRLQLSVPNVFVDLPSSLTPNERNECLSYLNDTLSQPPTDKRRLLSTIPSISSPSTAPLRVLSALLTAFPDDWPVFDLFQCYARLWKLLPEAAKSGQDDAELLSHTLRQVKNTYAGIHSLFTITDRPAIQDSGSSTHLSHRSLASFVRNFRLPVNIRTSEAHKPIIALALPNGPLIGLAILATTTHFTAAPVSVSSGAEQFRSDVSQAKASAVLVTEPDVQRLGLCDPWVKEAGIKVIVATSNADLTFSMSLLDPAEASSQDVTQDFAPNGPDDIALLLFTSGTSGTKKSVPLTVNTMVFGVAFVIESWGLRDDDICLNMMPLFHVGGIVRNLFAPIMAGGSTICCPAFDPNLFWDIIEDHQPTWYYASPSMHSVVLSESVNRQEALSKSNMRLICNAAGGLLPSLAYSLRDTFGCSVLPSYGMTECMPISSPKLDYQLDRPGTSGVSVGPEIGILGGDDNCVRSGVVGRIAVRGLPVFDGYLKSGGVLDTSPFTAAGWFDTGDMGYLDKDGYLYVTGRNKEVINRGGELISPFEVEEGILSAAQKEDSPIHGRVSAALAFAMPHDVLQEVVGIVLVTPPGALRACIKTVQEAIKDALNQVKWPAFVVYMDDLPKNNNKILRVKLAERLSLSQTTDQVPLARRHYEAQCPPPNTPLTTKIEGQMCTFELDLITIKLAQAVGSEYDVFVRTAKTDGYPEAFVAPKSTSATQTPYDSAVDLTKSLRHELSDYHVPGKVHYLDTSLPYNSNGEVDEVSLEAMIHCSDGSDNLADMTMTEAKIATIFAKILQCSTDELSPLSDFFEMGGDSLRAGRLLSDLRKEFRLRLPIDLLFTHGQIYDLASNIDELRRCTSDQDPEKALQSPVTNLGCTKTYSSTNPFLLVLQLIPLVVLYPMKRALTWTAFVYMLSATQYWFTAASIHGRLVNIIFSLGVGRAITQIVTPFLAILMKWIIIGKYKEGMYPMWGSYHTRWWFVQKMIAVSGKGVFTLSDRTIIWYYRLLGAKIGKNVTIANAATLAEYDLITIEDGANLDKCICRGFAAEQNTTMYLGKIHIGRNASVGLSSVVAPGTSLPEGACIGPNSSSWEASDAEESNRDLSTNKVPGAGFILDVLIGLPVAGVVAFCRAGPWMAGLVGLVRMQPQKSLDMVRSTVYWFAEPHRIAFHYTALILHAYCGPMAWFVAVLILKKLLDITIGKLRPGPVESRSRLQKLRMSLLRTIVPVKQFHKLSELFGSHYEVTSRLYRAMGAKIGSRVYWPGTGPTFQDFDLLDIGDNVVFGSRSHLITSDGSGSDFVRVGNGAMVSDRVVLLPGSKVGNRTVLGSGALTRRNQQYASETVWVGSKHGEAVCLTSSSRGQMTKEDFGEALGEKLTKITTEVKEKEISSSSSSERDLESGKGTPSVTVRSGSETPEVTQTVVSSSPFGRAFYEGKAPYRVFGLFTIFCYCSFITIFTAFYWNVGTTSSIQILAFLLRSTHVAFEKSFIIRPLIIYLFFTASIAILLTMQALIAIGLVIACKWILLGRRKAGNYDWDKSSYCQRWQLFLTIEKLRRNCYGGYGVLGMLTGTHYAVLYFRALGANIGKDCALFAGGLPSLMFTEPDLLTLGDRVSVDDASLVSHINSRGVFNLNPLSVGDRSVLRSGSRLLSGAHMGADSVLMEHTLVMAGDVVDDGCTMQGWPADAFEAIRAPLSK